MISEKIILLCTMKALEGQEITAQEKVMELLRLNNQNANCEFTSFHIDTKQNNRFMVYEIWKDQHAWLEQSKSSNVKKLQSDAQDLFSEYQLIN